MFSTQRTDSTSSNRAHMHHREASGYLKWQRESFLTADCQVLRASLIGLAFTSVQPLTLPRDHGLPLRPFPRSASVTYSSPHLTQSFPWSPLLAPLLTFELLTLTSFYMIYPHTPLRHAVSITISLELVLWAQCLIHLSSLGAGPGFLTFGWTFPPSHSIPLAHTHCVKNPNYIFFLLMPHFSDLCSFRLFCPNTAADQSSKKPSVAVSILCWKTFQAFQGGEKGLNTWVWT